MTTKGEKARQGITLCPRCYEEGKRSVLVYDKLKEKIFCYERKHEWTAEEFLEMVKHQ